MPNQVFGYSRVSIYNKNLHSENNALNKLGCEIIFEEKDLNYDNDRPILKEMLSRLRNDDIVIVWKLSRLGRSLNDLTTLLEIFKNNHINFISITDEIDTRTVTGRLALDIIASLAEFKRNVITEQTKGGLVAALACGHKLGRPKGLSKENRKSAKIVKIFYSAGIPIEGIVEKLNISKASVYRYLQSLKDNRPNFP